MATKQELERQIEKLEKRVESLQKNMVELEVQNRIMKNVTQAMLSSIDGKQVNVLEPQYNQSIMDRAVKMSFIEQEDGTLVKKPNLRAKNKQS